MGISIDSVIERVEMLREKNNKLFSVTIKKSSSPNSAINSLLFSASDKKLITDSNNENVDLDSNNNDESDTGSDNSSPHKLQSLRMGQPNNPKVIDAKIHSTEQSRVTDAKINPTGRSRVTDARIVDPDADAYAKKDTTGNKKTDGTDVDDEVEDLIVVRSIPEFVYIKDSEGFYKKDAENQNFYCLSNEDLLEDYKRLSNNMLKAMDEINGYQQQSTSSKDEDEKKSLKEKMSELEKKLIPMNTQMKKYNEELGKEYSDIGHASNYNGCKILRTTKNGELTNKSQAASTITLTLKGIEEKGAMRLRLPSGAYLELHFDKDGNFMDNEIIPLKTKAAHVNKRFSSKDIKCGNEDPLVYTDYDTILDKDLKQLQRITIINLDNSNEPTDVIDQIRKFILIKKQDRDSSLNDATRSSETEDHPLDGSINARGSNDERVDFAEDNSSITQDTTTILLDQDNSDTPQQNNGPTDLGAPENISDANNDDGVLFDPEQNEQDPLSSNDTLTDLSGNYLNLLPSQNTVINFDGKMQIIEPQKTGGVLDLTKMGNYQEIPRERSIEPGGKISHKADQITSTLSK